MIGKIISNKFISAIFALACILGVGCEKTCSTIDDIAKSKLIQPTQLLIERSNVALQSHKISNTQEGIATFSTSDVDNFVKKKMSTWMNTARDLENFSHDYPTSRFSKDLLFVAALLWSGISQADQQYSDKTISLYKEILDIDASSKGLNKETIDVLTKVPSLNYIIKTEEWRKKNSISLFLRRMLITEYLKKDDTDNAEKWLKTINISTEEKQQLNEYINSYRLLQNKLAE